MAEQVDRFQPIAVVHFLRDAKATIRNMPETVWSDDMKRGALLALAWAQTQVLGMAEHRHDPEGE